MGKCSFLDNLNHMVQILPLLGGTVSIVGKTQPTAWVEVPVLLSWASCLNALFPHLYDGHTTNTYILGLL